MALTIDVRVGGARAQFATQLAHVSPNLLAEIKRGFVGEETVDFYEGLLAGFAAAYVIAEFPRDHVQTYLGAIIAYLSCQPFNKSPSNDGK